MKMLVQAILTTWAAHATGAGPFVGIFGPYWDIAPEKGPGDTVIGYPRCIISQLPAGKLVWGFGGGLYPEPVNIQFKVFANDLVATATLADAIAYVYDLNRLGLNSTDICKMALRNDAPMMKKEPTWGGDGLAVYSGTLVYRYSVQRTT